jgi:hypothetical protein
MKSPCPLELRQVIPVVRDVQMKPPRRQVAPYGRSMYDGRWGPGL